MDINMTTHIATKLTQQRQTLYNRQLQLVSQHSCYTSHQVLCEQDGLRQPPGFDDTIHSLKVEIDKIKSQISDMDRRIKWMMEKE